MNIDLHPSLRMLVCFSGVFISYAVFGLIQESIMKIPVDGKFFEQISCLVLVQCAFNVAVAYSVIEYRKNSTHIRVHDMIPAPMYALCAFCYMAAMAMSGSALKYVGYPMQVLGKSTKPVFVMIMGVLMARKRYHPYRYICVLLIVSGVALFMYRKSHPESVGQGFSIGYGELLILASLVFDGLTGAVQDRMKSAHKVVAYSMMYNMNLWSCLWSAIAAVALGETRYFVSFISAHPWILLKILLLSVAGAVGQVFIFLTIEWFGPLACSVITTTRKFFTIFLSVCIFGHPLDYHQWVGASLVFTGLGFDNMMMRRKPVVNI